MPKSTALALGLLALVGGHGDSQRTKARTQLIGFDTYMKAAGEFEATKLVRLDSKTFRRLPGRGLRLADAASSYLVGPDGRTLAVGGVNYGEVVFVDLARLTQTQRVQLAPRTAAANIRVQVVSWPRPHRLLAVVSQAPGKYLLPARLVLVDPVRRRVLRSVPLDGAVLSWVQAGDRRVLFLVSRIGRIGRARLAIASTSGHTRTITLRRIRAGQGKRGRDYGVELLPSLASDGHRAFVVGGRAPIASINLRTLAVAYHEVPRLMKAHLRLTPPTEAGSAGPLLAFFRKASWLGEERLLVTGSDEFPAAGSRARWVTRAASIVDTRTWELAHVFPSVGDLQAVDGVFLGSGTQSIEKRAFGPSLVAFRPDGTILYRKRQSNLWWSVVAGRVIAGAADGSRLAELNPRTGERFRLLGRASIWPLEVLAWTLPRRR